jgi:hypothetical protein
MDLDVSVNKTGIMYLVFLVLLFVCIVWFVKCTTAECEAKECPNGMKATTVHYRCICVVIPK